MQPEQPGIQPNYDFITNPQQAPRRLPLGGGSTLSRVLIVGVGLILLIILFSIVKGLLSGGGNKAAMLHVVQDQQAIIHLTTAANQQPVIALSNKNFAVTGQLAIASEQQQLTSYLAKHSQKISLKQQSLKVSSAVDKQLTGALASSTYDATFQSVMKSQVTDYAAALKLAYQQTPGPVGRKLLTEDYNTAVLLLQQLSLPVN